MSVRYAEFVTDAVTATVESANFVTVSVTAVFNCCQVRHKRCDSRPIYG